jgi:PAS domain S-box-containing protein
MVSAEVRDARAGGVIVRLQSVRTRLLAVILAVALPLAAVMAYIWWQSLQDGRAREVALLRANVRQIESDLQHLRTASEWVLSRMAMRPAFRELTPAACNDEMVMLREVNPAFLLITLWTRNATLVCSSEAPRPDRPPPKPHQASFDEGIAADSLYLTNVFVGPITGLPLVTFTYPVRDATGATIGLLGVVVQMSYFEALILRVERRPGSAVGIVDRNLNLVARVPDNRSWQGKSIASLPGVVSALKAKEGAFNTTGVDGVQRIVVHKTVPEIGWHVYVGVEESVLFAGYRRQLIQGAIAFATVVVLSLALAHAIGRGIAGPLHGLVTVAEAVARGDRTARATPEGGGEIARLAGHLNRMLDELTRSEASLRASNLRLRAILETEPACVTVLGADGFVREKNAAGLAVLDADTLEQLRSRRLIDLVVAEYRPSFEEFFRRVMAGESGVLEYELETLKGRRLWLEMHAAPLRDADGNVSDMLGITLDITERRAAERMLRLSMARARDLAARLLNAEEAERKRLAHDLHDQIGQELTALRMRVELLARAAGSEAMRPQLAEIAAVAGETLERVRQMSVDLRPPQLDTLGLAAALRAHVERQGELGQLAVHFDSRGFPRDIPPAIEIVCFRVVQEALTNVMRHSGASNAWVVLGVVGAVLSATVRDDGAGFDVQAVLERDPGGSGLGLPGMRERVALVGGTLDIRSQPGQGCTVTAQFALAGPAETA